MSLLKCISEWGVSRENVIPRMYECQTDRRLVCAVFSYSCFCQSSKEPEATDVMCAVKLHAGNVLSTQRVIQLQSSYSPVATGGVSSTASAQHS